MSERRGEWYGNVVRSERTGGVRLSLIAHARPREIEQHEHRLAYFCFLLEGAYRETHDGVTIEYEPFSIAFHPPRYTHSDAIVRPDTTFFAIELEEGWQRLVGNRFDISAWSLELQHGEAVWLAAALLKAFIGDRLHDDIDVEETVSEMLGIALRVVDRERPERAWVARARNIAHARFAERITLDDIADEVGVHPASLARGFRVDHGVTLGDYVSRLRVQHACRLMARGQSLASVAHACGFADQSHLTRAFKAIAGMTPGLLRRRLAVARTASAD